MKGETIKCAMKKTIQTVLFTAFLISNAQASDCLENAQDQSEMNMCTKKEYLIADAELNQRFKQISQQLKEDENTHHLLRNAEKAWVTFRDAECVFVASKAADSTSYPMAYNICLTNLTQKRSEQFLKYLNCEEMDLDCPVPWSDKVESEK